MLSESTPAPKIKLELNGEIRRVLTPMTYDDLVRMVKETYDNTLIEDGTHVRFSYRDTDGHVITIVNDADLNEAHQD